MIVLHIGNAKAGSTTIQNFLAENRDRLPFMQLETFGIGHAWKIAAANGTQRSRDYWTRIRPLLTEAELTEMEHSLWQEAADEHQKKGGGDLIASSEFIYGQYAEDREHIETLRDNLLDLFGSVKLIVYFREQISFVKSLYGQSIRGPVRTKKRYDDFVDEVLRNRPGIHYGRRMQLWCDVFGQENISPAVFHRDNFPDGDLLTDFCRRADLPTEGIDITRDTSKNRTPPARYLEALRLLNVAGVRNAKARRAAAAVLKYGVRQTALPQDQDRRILEAVSDGNDWMNRTFFTGTPVKLPVLS